MCIFQSGQDIPPLVRISLRTLQYLVIPLLSLAILVVGAIHLGKCSQQPLLPVWHIIAGSSGLLTPVFYLLFDEFNPWISPRLPGLSACMDNIVVFLLPLYVIFEIGWLITGSVWTFGTPEMSDPEKCDHTIYVFSFVVMMNFWIHVLTPLIFMIVLCFTRIFPYCAYCGYWNILKKAMDNWTRPTRLLISVGISFPLGAAMIIAGGISVEKCDSESTANVTAAATAVLGTINDIDTTLRAKTTTVAPSILPDLEDLVHIPVWLIVAGAVVLMVPLVYFIYDKYCKEESSGPLIKSIANCLVIGYLLCGLAWAVVGFLWVFGNHQHVTCGADSFTYQFAFGTLIILNIIMDIWICFKICVVLYWAFLSED